MITIGPWTFPKQPAHTSDLKAVRDMLEYGFKVSEIAKRLGRAEKTIYTWRRRYGWGGPREVAKKIAAPTEPRARTAAALRAMAADMEDADAPMTPNHADHTVIGKLRWTANDHLYFGKIYVGRVFRDIFGTYQVVPENWVSLRRMDMPTRDDACAALVQAVKEAIND